MAGTTQTVIRSRGAIPRDLHRLQQIAAECLGEQDFEQFRRDEAGILSGRVLCIVASPVFVGEVFHTDGPVIGFITLYVHELGVNVAGLAVRADCRRVGVASHLLGHAKSKLRGHRKQAQIRVAERNLPAQLLLRSEGFRCTKIEPNTNGDFEPRYLFEFRRGIEDVAMARRGL